MAFCENCGESIAEGTQFCRECGTRVAAQSPVKAPSALRTPLVLLGVIGGGGLLVLLLVACLASGWLFSGSSPTDSGSPSSVSESGPPAENVPAKFNVYIQSCGPVPAAKATVTISDGNTEIQREMMNPGSAYYPSSVNFTSKTGNIYVAAQSTHEADVVGVTVMIRKWEGTSAKQVARADCQGSFCIAQCSYP